MKPCRFFVSIFILIVLLSFGPPQTVEASGQGAGPGRGGQGTRVVDVEEIALAIETHLHRLIQDGRKRIEVKDVRGYEKIVVPQGLLTFEVLLPEQASRGGMISPTVHFFVNGQEVKRARFHARADIYGNVLIATRYLRRHHVVQSEDLQWANRNLSTLPPDVATEMKDILGKRTTLSVNSNEILRMSMVEVPPLVNKGDQVILLIENEQFRITTLGEAKEGGRKGDRVRLLNLASRKEVCGRILDANTVRIDFK